jgi:HME family heavy-metal exporter
VVRVNTRGRDLDSAVKAIQGKIADNVRLPSGYFILYGGQFEAQKSATRRILLLSLVSLAGVFVVLYMALPSTSLVLQVLLSIPLAFVGGVAALVLTDQTLSVAGMVGFISLGGIAARNGILLVSTYVALYADRGFNKQMIVEGSMDRLAPVLMTALTTGIGLLPLVNAGQLPGKEILFPVATVILGGLITSTMAEFLMRPGLFWYLSHKATKRIARDRRSADSLAE